MTDVGPDQTSGSGSKEAVSAVRDRFEAYLDDARTRVEQAQPAGTTRSGAGGEIDRMAHDTRRRIEQAKDASEAEQAFQSFKDEVRRMRP